LSKLLEEVLFFSHLPNERVRILTKQTRTNERIDLL